MDLPVTSPVHDGAGRADAVEGDVQLAILQQRGGLRGGCLACGDHEGNDDERDEHEPRVSDEHDLLHGEHGRAVRDGVEETKQRTGRDEDETGQRNSRHLTPSRPGIAGVPAGSHQGCGVRGGS